MRKLRKLIISGVVGIGVVVGGTFAAHAEIYKYTLPDGTTIYTDKLSDLPKDVRAKYARRAAEKAKRRARLEASVGKREAARREAEEKRKAQLERQIAEAQALQRQQEIRALIKRIDKSAAKEAEKKAKWQKRVIEARSRVKGLFEEFKKTREAYDTLAVRADFTLFPGQNQKKGELRKKLEKLEKELDEALKELNEKIPDEARKAGIPPGWLRVKKQRNPPT